MAAEQASASEIAVTCPMLGMTTIVEFGNWLCTCSACGTSVRRSRSPLTISVGVFG